MKIVKILVIALATTVSTVSCNRFLDITPTGQVIPHTQDDFRALLTRAYNLYPQHKALANLKSDEIVARNSDESLKAIYTWEENVAAPSSMEMPYSSLYQGIFFTNYIIENALKNVPAGAEINQTLGEAHALRALIYFELINLYAPVYNGSNGQELAVPLVTGINLEAEFPKASLDEIYTQIFSDVNVAQQLLNQAKFDAGYNYRFTTVALSALKARIHQYRSEWKLALDEANKVLAINSELEDFNNFSNLPNSYLSKESIMNLDLAVNSSSNSFSKVSENHIQLFDQTNDLRFGQYFRKDRNDWRTKKYDTKNKLKITFRVGEILLIKAEAQAKLNQEQASKETLLKLAEKRYNPAGLEAFKNKISGLNGEAYYTELLNERARETSFEGLRWFDLRRTTQPQIIHQFDGKEYILKAKDPRYTIPFPKSVRLKNPQL